VEINKLDEFSYYKQLQSQINYSVGNNFYLNLFLFFIFAIIWVILLGFGSPILIMSGIFFGKWIGTLVSLLSISIGALILYIIANYFFRDFIKNLLKEKFEKYIFLFKKNEFYYFFAFRFVGGLGIPFGLQNVLPVIFNISRTNYFIASILGFVPNFYIWNTIGSGINSVVETSNSFSFLNFLLNEEIYLPIMMFLVLICVSFFIRKKLFKVND
tara:strand:- start:1555 stop:2196 length:642 start_codon:yes stop_codon:yes gene_type:complete